MDLPPNRKTDSYWANKKSLENEDEIYAWASHDFNNFNNYTIEKYKAWLTSCKHFFAKDFVLVNPQGEVPGFDGYLGVIELYFNSFSEIHIEIEDFFVKEERLAVHYLMSGKNTGEFMGNPPTGKEFKMRSIEVFRFAGGKMAAGFSFGDTIGFMQQLGLM